VEHRNLHEWGHSAAEVGASMRKDYKRDHRTLTFYDVAGAACLAFVLRSWQVSEIAAALGCYIFTVSALRLFVDQSNRNWFLHRVNWDAQIADDAQEKIWQEEEARRRDDMYEH
jgi:2-methylcitrate dehydratase PrpD